MDRRDTGVERRRRDDAAGECKLLPCAYEFAAICYQSLTDLSDSSGAGVEGSLVGHYGRRRRSARESQLRAGAEQCRLLVCEVARPVLGLLYLLI